MATPDRASSSTPPRDDLTAEDDSLLTGERSKRYATEDGSRTWKFWCEIGLFVWAVLATALVIVLAVVYQKAADSQYATPDPETGSGGKGGHGKNGGKKNLIFMVSDGMGPTSLSLTRSYMQFQENLPYSDKLVLDSHLIGQSRTRSSSSLVTDSAAGATAFSCAHKSYNGAISVTPDHLPCGTVLEAAKKAGYMTGLVVTTRITDATPATFAAHVHIRQEEDLIAQQMVGENPLGRVVDLMLGGGRCHFLPASAQDSCRTDDRNIVSLAQDTYNFTYISDRAGFDALKPHGGKAPKLPLLGLFAPTDIPYEVDRQQQEEIYPSLTEMAQTALHALTAATRDSDKGFFLMIEGSRIDHAGHHNDAAAQVHEVLAYDKAFASVLDFVNSSPALKGSTAIVSTSDHETGGLATARQLNPNTYPNYAWYPSALANITHSAEYLAAEFASFLSSLPSPSAKAIRLFAEDAVERGLGIHDFAPEEIDRIVADPDRALYAFADMGSRRSQSGWSTHGHSGADVNIYAYSKSNEKNSRDLVADLTGNVENTDVGAFLANFLGVEDGVQKVTEELKGIQLLDEEHKDWMGPLPEEGERLDGQDHLGGYEGDFRRKRDEGWVHETEGCGHVH